MRIFLKYCLTVLTIILITCNVYGNTITVEGTQAEKQKLATWLSCALGTTVTIDTNGKLQVGSGGNASATRLRNMANDPSTSAKLKVVSNASNVLLGGWQSTDPANRYGPTTGTQLIDIKDLESIGNVLNNYGYTPGMILMHEITEVYEGVKNGTNYLPSHKKGIEAENELMQAHNTSTFGPKRYYKQNGKIFTKIKRPNGTYRVIELENPYATNTDIKWYKEKVACKSIQGLIAIADPDPFVHVFEYDFGGNHTAVNQIDAGVNVFPNGVAYNTAGLLHVAEKVTGSQDRIRIFDTQYNVVDTISDSHIVNPEGIDVDKDTGDIFVAVDGGVARYDSGGNYLGVYNTGALDFMPTDVGVWRNHSTDGVYGDGSLWEIFVTDRSTDSIYRFDVIADMDNMSYQSQFGSTYLDSPEGLCVTDVGSVFAASTGNDTICAFGLDGLFEGILAEDITRNFYDVEMMGEEEIWVVDNNGALVVYDYEGNETGSYGTGSLQCPTTLTKNFTVDESNLVSVPEPDSIILILVGLLSTLAMRRKLATR